VPVQASTRCSITTRSGTRAGPPADQQTHRATSRTSDRWGRWRRSDSRLLSFSSVQICVCVSDSVCVCPSSGGAVLEVLQSSGATRRPDGTQRLPPLQRGNQTHVGGDEANKNGGKWIIRLRKGLASRFWENIILAMLGEQFMVGEEICGVVVSIRFQEDILSIWNKTANDQVTTSRIRDTLRRVLNLPPNTIMEYKTHNDSLKDNSSFRNTKITL
uniref:Eukaryotic translation initiation factor 4E family member 2 related sequence 1 n=1 Tax=Cyprinus carpio TaxID=7962 RepID=A0A8C1T3L1_CYPCA